MSKAPFLRTPYNYDRNAASDESGLCCEDESLAIQSAAEEADINTIVRRFGLTGQLPAQVAMPRSGDFTNVPDFHSAMNLICQAQEEFMRVPGEIRARFNNDPQQFMEFLEDDRNVDEAVKLGLAVRKAVPVVPPSGTPDGGAAS
jgi:phage internal scaffolding protein